MASGLAAQYQAALDATFIQRVTLSALATAQAISTEATSAANHTNRVALMKAVADNPNAWGTVFAYSLAAQAIDTNSTDAAINSMVSSVWNTIAGVV